MVIRDKCDKNRPWKVQQRFFAPVRHIIGDTAAAAAAAAVVVVVAGKQ